MKKIAILVNEDTMNRCMSTGCVRAILNKEDAFARYGDEEIQFVGISHGNGDMDKKFDQLFRKCVDTIHISTCMRSKGKAYEDLGNLCLEAGFNVVGYTHGNEVSKDGIPAIVACIND